MMTVTLAKDIFEQILKSGTKIKSNSDLNFFWKLSPHIKDDGHHGHLWTKVIYNQFRN